MLKIVSRFAWVFVVVAVPLSYAQPLITEHPQGQSNVPPGESVVLSVDAIGKDPLSYQWRRNGVNIPLATEKTLVLQEITPMQGGLYSAVVSDAEELSSESDYAEITFNIMKLRDNDSFQQRPLLESSSGVLASDNREATKEETEPDHAGNPGGKSVWFRWIAPANGIVTFSTAGSSFDTILAAYRGNEIGKLSIAPGAISDDDRGGFLTSKLSFNALEREEYQIVVDGLWGESGNMVLNWHFEETEDVLAQISQMPTNHTVAFGADLDLNVEFDRGSPLWLFDDSPIEIEENKNVLELRKIDERHVGRYSMRIRTREHDTTTIPANIQINISEDESTDPTVAALDKFASAAHAVDQRIKERKGTVTASSGPSRAYSTTQIFSTWGSTKDPGEPNHCGIAGGASEWFSYQAPMTGTLHINTDGSNYDTVLAVYKGAGFGYEYLTSVACNNKPSSPGGDRVRFPATLNTIYYIAVDGVGGAKGTVNLNVNIGTSPALTSPASRSVGQGSNTTFTVTATGTTPMYYQWRLNGVNIAAATASSYTRTNVQPAHAGNYTCYVSNRVNVATSTAAALTVLTPPVITTQPASKTVTIGSNPSLSVTATGSPTPKYQWLFNNANISWGTNATLTLTNFQTTAEGAYCVVMSNSMSIVTSAVATVRANAPLRVGAYSLGTNGFALEVIGGAGTNYILDVSTNLVLWTPISTNSSASGFLNLVDDTPVAERKFYRIRTTP